MSKDCSSLFVATARWTFEGRTVEAPLPDCAPDDGPFRPKQLLIGRRSPSSAASVTGTPAGAPTGMMVPVGIVEPKFAPQNWFS